MSVERLILQKPTAEMEQAALDYKSEYFQAGEMVLHGDAMLDSMEYGPWLRRVLENWGRKSAHGDLVPASTFFAVRESDGRIIGMVNIRHELNEVLAAYGGHIGYGVRPSERRKGYATAILKMALAYAKELGLSRVMLACDRDNKASRKTIVNCGGKLEREVIDADGNVVQVYWIML